MVHTGMRSAYSAQRLTSFCSRTAQRNNNPRKEDPGECREPSARWERAAAQEGRARRRSVLPDRDRAGFPRVVSSPASRSAFSPLPRNS